MMLRRTALAILTVTAVACSGTGETPQVSSTADRVEAIRQARQAVEEPAVALGSAALTLAERMERLGVIDESELGPALDSAADAAAELRDASDAAAEVDLDLGVPDTADAAAALQTAAEAGEEAAVAADTVIVTLRRANEIDIRLTELVEGWEERGSRQQLLDHFAALADEADALAAEVEAEAVDDGCSAVLDLRVEAARTVGAGTRELRDLIARYQGNEYDVRQPELYADPYGVGTSLFLVSQEREFCPLVHVVAGTVVDVTDALGRMQDALAPSDL